MGVASCIQNRRNRAVLSVLLVVSVASFCYALYQRNAFDEPKEDIIPIDAYADEIRHLLKPWEKGGIRKHHVKFRDYDAEAGMIQVVIRRGRIYYSNNVDDYPYAKRQRLDIHLRSVIHHLRSSGFEVPDVVFLTPLEPVATEHTEMLESLGLPPRPVFTLSKTKKHKDVLMPNMYFEDLLWWRHQVAKVVMKSSRIPWSTRIPKAFWLGSCGVEYNSTKDRVDALLIQDNRFTNMSLLNRCPADQWYSDGLISETERDRILNISKSSKINRFQFANYRYNVQLPGEKKGTYSRHLQNLLPLSTTVLKWDNPYYEFYYMPRDVVMPTAGHRHIHDSVGFKEGVHYVAVNSSNLYSKVAWLIDNDDVAQELAQNAVDFFFSHATSEHILGYWKRLLATYADLQRFDVREFLRTDGLAPIKGYCTCLKPWETLSTLSYLSERWSASIWGHSVCNFCQESL